MIRRILDVATAPIEGVDAFIEPIDPEVPGSYKKPESIAQWIAEEKPKLIEQAKQKAISRAALDLDLCRISAIGMLGQGGEPEILLCQNEAEEAVALEKTALFFDTVRMPNIAITFAGLHFDLPVLQRRALYLGVPFPKLNLDRYRTPHIDLMELLSGGDRDRRRSLQFFCKRLGWSDLVKPLSGAEEAQVFSSERWEDLRASLVHDLTATSRLATFARVW